MKGFTEEQTMLLLNLAVQARKNGQAISKVFNKVAEDLNKASGSVRNYYYALIKSHMISSYYKKVDGIELLTPKKARQFSHEEEEFLLNYISDGRKSGKSVRKILSELSDGDDTLYLRYQNKYRLILKKQQQEKLKDIPIRPEDFRYFAKLSREIDFLVEKIKDKYAAECVKLNKENQRLKNELKLLRKEPIKSGLKQFFITDKKA